MVQDKLRLLPGLRRCDGLRVEIDADLQARCQRALDIGIIARILLNRPCAIAPVADPDDGEFDPRVRHGLPVDHPLVGGDVDPRAGDGACRAAHIAAVLIKIRSVIGVFRHRIVKVPCPGLVECIEQGQLDGPAVDAVLTRCLGPHLQQPVDAVVLGCTHYPFVRRQIARCVGADAAIFDGGEGTARETMRRLAQRGLLRQGGEGSVTLRNSRSTPEILALSQRLLDLPAL